MNKKALILITLAVLAGCTAKEEMVEELTPEEKAAAQEAAEESCYVEGEMIVELSESMTEMVEKDLAKGAFLQTKSSGMNDIFSDLGVTSVERLYPDAGEWEPRHRAWGLHRWYIIKYSGEIPHTKAAEGLEMVDGIDYVEKPHKIYNTAVVNDPYFSQQWHYYNDGSLASTYRSGCDIDVVPVWQNYTGGVSDVIVAVDDGGIDLTHEDLAAVCIAGGANGSKNFVDNTYQITAHSHGTHVAGTIGAINNNGKGVCGIAGGLDGRGGVKLLSCQMFQTNSSTGKDVSGNSNAAMVWGADHGAVISQNSWGYVYDNASQAASGSVGSMKSAIDYFIANAGMDANGNQTGPMAGGVVIFAAGNDGFADGWPAEYAPVIAVGATSGAYKRAYYSNYGDWVDICAPGGDAQVGHMILSTLPDNKYGTMQGTSMACPHVSGVAALIVSYFGGKGFTNKMLEEKLIGGARTGVISSSAQIGNLVDAMGSFGYGSTKAPDMVTKYSVTPRSNAIDFSVTVPADEDDKQAYGLMLLASKNKASLTALSPTAIPSDVTAVTMLCNSAKAGDTVTGAIEGLEFETPYYAAVIAYDYNGNYSSVSSVKSVTTEKNNPPVVATDYTGDFQVKSHITLTVGYTISDPDGHNFTVKFTPGSSAASSSQLSDGSYQLTIVGNKADPGNYTAEYTVTDSYGAVNEYKIDYTILENHAPEILQQMDNQIFESAGSKMTIDMDKYLYDPDGETLKYSISISNRVVLHINPKENLLYMTTLDYGLVDVSITGSDARGLQCTLKFKVLVRDPESPADIYPNPVVKDSDGNSILYVSGGVEKETSVKITSASGTVVFDGKKNVSAFSPYSINMNACAAGKYYVTVTIDGNTTTKSIVKL